MMRYTLACSLSGVLKSTHMRQGVLQLSVVFTRCQWMHYHTRICLTYAGLNYTTRSTNLLTYFTGQNKSLSISDTGRTVVMLLISSDGILCSIMPFHLVVGLNSMYVCLLGGVNMIVCRYHIYQHIRFLRTILDSQYNHLGLNYCSVSWYPNYAS